MPSGFLPSLLADIARAAHLRAVYVAADEAQMRAVFATAGYFAPELEILQLPAWDCLPYDRISPNSEIASRRMATLAALADGLMRR